MNGRRLQFGVAVIEDKLYVVGGRDGLKTLNTVECYDPKKKSWTLMPPMATHRHGLGLCNLVLWSIGGSMISQRGCTNLLFGKIRHRGTRVPSDPPQKNIPLRSAAVKSCISYLYCSQILNIVRVYFIFHHQCKETWWSTRYIRLQLGPCVTSIVVRKSDSCIFVDTVIYHHKWCNAYVQPPHIFYFNTARQRSCGKVM